MKQAKNKKQWGLVIFALAYIMAVWWVFTKSMPLSDDREVTIRIGHWQIELGPPDGIQAAIDRYMELNPNVRVKQLLVPGGVYRQWIRAILRVTVRRISLSMGQGWPGYRICPCATSIR